MSIAESTTRDVVAEGPGVRPGCSFPRGDQETTDGELLRRFVADRDETAFAQLVARHAAQVIGVCRRALGNEQDAEDAFQATFLVLARKAASVRQAKSLPAWLYQTAYRIALRARAARSRRKEQSFGAETMIPVETFSQIASEHELSVLDEELNRLPEKYRLPLFLCCVEGKPREQAAVQLGLSEGAVKGRLERGRQLLRRRLMLRGVSLSVALGIVAGLQSSAHAAQTVAPSLIAATVQAGMQYAAGNSALGLVSQNALFLANGSLQVMSLTTAKIVSGCLLFAGALALISTWVPAPAIAGGEKGETVVLSAQLAADENLDSEVALLAEDERGDQPRSADGDGRRRSGEGEEQGRRSPEAEAGPRRPAEGEGRRRSAEGDRATRRSAEGDGGALEGFKPQTRREAALYQMILQLQREVAQLRQAVQKQSGGEGDAGARAVGQRDGEAAAAPAGWERTKAGGVFKAYDKNGDLYVALDEWLAMTNGNINATRRELQTSRFREARPGSDGKLSPAEFIRWWNGREGSQRDGDQIQRGPRDGEGEAAGESRAAGETDIPRRDRQ